jgi:hypothetical protein
MHDVAAAASTGLLLPPALVLPGHRQPFAFMAVEQGTAL